MYYMVHLWRKILIRHEYVFFWNFLLKQILMPRNLSHLHTMHANTRLCHKEILASRISIVLKRISKFFMRGWRFGPKNIWHLWVFAQCVKWKSFSENTVYFQTCLSKQISQSHKLTLIEIRLYHLLKYWTQSRLYFVIPFYS